jgi:hypothetical protein
MFWVDEKYVRPRLDILGWHMNLIKTVEYTKRKVYTRDRVLPAFAQVIFYI